MIVDDLWTKTTLLALSVWACLCLFRRLSSRFGLRSTNPTFLKFGVRDVLMARLPGRLYHWHLENALKALERGQSSWDVNIPLTSTMHLTGESESRGIRGHGPIS